MRRAVNLCCRCGQEIKNEPTLTFLGLSIIAAAGVVEWRGGEELTPLYDRRRHILQSIMQGGAQGVTASSLVSRYGNAFSVHLTAIRQWLDENCLPLKIIYRKSDRRYVMIEAQEASNL